MDTSTKKRHINNDISSESNQKNKRKKAPARNINNIILHLFLQFLNKQDITLHLGNDDIIIADLSKRKILKNVVMICGINFQNFMDKVFGIKRKKVSTDDHMCPIADEFSKIIQPFIYIDRLTTLIHLSQQHTLNPIEWEMYATSTATTTIVNSWNDMPTRLKKLQIFPNYTENGMIVVDYGDVTSDTNNVIIQPSSIRVPVSQSQMQDPVFQLNQIDHPSDTLGFNDDEQLCNIWNDFTPDELEKLSELEIDIGGSNKCDRNKFIKLGELGELDELDELGMDRNELNQSCAIKTAAQMYQVATDENEEEITIATDEVTISKPIMEMTLVADEVTISEPDQMCQVVTTTNTNKEKMTLVTDEVTISEPYVESQSDQMCPVVTTIKTNKEEMTLVATDEVTISKPKKQFEINFILAIKNMESLIKKLMN